MRLAIQILDENEQPGFGVILDVPVLDLTVLPFGMFATRYLEPAIERIKEEIEDKIV